MVRIVTNCSNRGKLMVGKETTPGSFSPQWRGNFLTKVNRVNCKLAHLLVSSFPESCLLGNKVLQSCFNPSAKQRVAELGDSSPSESWGSRNSASPLSVSLISLLCYLNIPPFYHREIYLFDPLSPRPATARINKRKRFWTKQIFTS